MKTTALIEGDLGAPFERAVVPVVKVVGISGLTEVEREEKRALQQAIQEEMLAQALIDNPIVEEGIVFPLPPLAHQKIMICLTLADQARQQGEKGAAFKQAPAPSP